MASLTDDPSAYAEMKQAYRDEPERATRAYDVPEATTARIARLAKEVAEDAHQLDGSRTTYDKAARNKQECQARFVSLSEELLNVIHEHREGTPEGVPYQR